METGGVEWKGTQEEFGSLEKWLESRYDRVGGDVLMGLVMGLARHRHILPMTHVSLKVGGGYSVQESNNSKMQSPRAERASDQ